MVPDPYTLEKMALAHRQQLQHEAEHEQMPGALPTHSSLDSPWHPIEKA